MRASWPNLLRSRRIQWICCTLNVVLLLLLGAAPARSVPVTLQAGFVSNSPQCDPLGLSVGQTLEEIGTNPAVVVPFPADSVITASHVVTALSACAATDGPEPNYAITITNLTGRTFTDLWYVGDTAIALSNFDGLVGNGPTFKIDAVGVNQPLISESLASDGIFQPGETWVFVAQIDFIDLNATSPSAFGSVDAGQGCIGGCSHFTGQSSASIIGILPEPSLALLMGSGFGLLGLRRGRTGSLASSCETALPS